MSNTESSGEHPNFVGIRNEIFRQYEQGIRTGDSLDSKIGIMLGIIFVGIGLIGNLIDPIESSQQIMGHFFTFSIGLILLLISALLGLLAFYIRKWDGGPDIKELIDIYRADSNRDFEMIVARKIDDSRITNREVNRLKSKLAKTMFIVFFLALFFIVISQLQYLAGG